MFAPDPQPGLSIVPRAVWHSLVAAALMWLGAGVALAAPAGTVVGLAGKCVVESGGTKSALKLGQPVEVGDTVDIPADGKLKLRMIDGSVISLAARTQMTISAYAADTTGRRQDARLSLIQGLLRAVVAPVEHPANFEVDTASGTAAVRSTDWFVETSANEMRVRVLRGSVALTSAATKRSETIHAHWAGRLRAGHDPAPPRVLRRSEFDALIARTRVALGEAAPRQDRNRAPVRGRATGRDRGREGRPEGGVDRRAPARRFEEGWPGRGRPYERGVDRRPPPPRSEEGRPRPETAHEHPKGREKEGEGRHD